MVKRHIKMRPDEVQAFVSAASKCDFDIDIYYNRYIVDAKSFLGVMGLNFNQVLTVQYNEFNEEFEQYLQRLAIAC